MVKSNLVKLDTSRTVILAHTVIFLWAITVAITVSSSTM